MSLTRDEYLKQVLAIKVQSMHAWLWRVTHEEQSLEDLGQDAYEQLLGVPDGELSTIASVEAYARGVCRNIAMNWLRTRKSRRGVLEYVDTCDVYADEKQSPEPILRARERLDRVRRALEQLPERRRLALILRRIYGFTAEEIAMKMGIKVPTVKRMLHNATRSLEVLLSREGAADDLRLLQHLLGAKE